VQAPRTHDHGEGQDTSGPQLTGRNRENRLVHFAGPETPEALVGLLVPVVIERAGPYALVGRLAG